MMTQPTTLQQIEQRIDQLTSITLRDIENVALLNRVDTKYLMTETHLLAILAEIGDRYDVLVVDDHRMGRYATQYFDTSGLSMYFDHHNGRRDRFKVRVRSYEHSGIAFLEVKRKTCRERTVKARMPIAFGSQLPPSDAEQFVGSHTPYALPVLQRSLWNNFRRISLVSKHHLERLTIDVDLHLGYETDERMLPGLVIAELKQPKFSAQSHIVQQMRHLQITPAGFSKYCIGIALLHPAIKRNRFKELFMRIDRLLQTRETL